MFANTLGYIIYILYSHVYIPLVHYLKRSIPYKVALLLKCMQTSYKTPQTSYKMAHILTLILVGIILFFKFVGKC
jgi:hypothetical protein